MTPGWTSKTHHPPRPGAGGRISGGGAFWGGAEPRLRCLRSRGVWGGFSCARERPHPTSRLGMPRNKALPPARMGYFVLKAASEVFFFLCLCRGDALEPGGVSLVVAAGG